MDSMPNAAYVPGLWRTACVWCLCTVVAVVRATCPENAVEKVMTCPGQLGLPVATPENAFVEKGQVEVAKQACREGKFAEALKCQENIIEACQGNSDQEHYLRSMIDLEKQRNFVALFCSQLDEYEVHAPCIAKMHDERSQCLAEQRKNMQTKVKASANIDFLMLSGCKYFFAAEFCSKKVLRKACGGEAADMVSRLFVAFKPPFCDTVTYTQDQGDLDTEGSGSSASRLRLSLAEVTFHVVLVLVMSYTFSVMS
ncbi:uncharacterized protein [Littorina saxatilis]|uniref:Secreted protein n=1 Tax=Littorina saxatilis TaxID=31220 RepID=A0AAN9BAY4_9CAEN